MPPGVRRLIEERGDAAHFPSLKRAAAALSDAYREGKSTRLAGDDDLTAYLVTRMPATYAAARAALGELPELEIRSVLDIGAGSGAAALAARERFPQAKEFTLIERDPSLADAAREFLPEARVVAADVTAMRDFPVHDLVIAAYSLGEIASELVGRLWTAARVALVVIEPGTPRGAARILSVREHLLAVGAHLAAPCPGPVTCPLKTPDWCHFAARVERTSLHRKLKGGDLGYEDEKYSYVAVTRESVPTANTRVLRHPRHSAGLIVLELCTSTGARSIRVTKRNKDEFRAARKTAWGSAFAETGK